MSVVSHVNKKKRKKSSPRCTPAAKYLAQTQAENLNPNAFSTGASTVGETDKKVKRKTNSG